MVVEKQLRACPVAAAMLRRICSRTMAAVFRPLGVLDPQLHGAYTGREHTRHPVGAVSHCVRPRSAR